MDAAGDVGSPHDDCTGDDGWPPQSPSWTGDGRPQDASPVDHILRVATSGCESDRRHIQPDEAVMRLLERSTTRWTLQTMIGSTQVRSGSGANANVWRNKAATVVCGRCSDGHCAVKGVKNVIHMTTEQLCRLCVAEDDTDDLKEGCVRKVCLMHLRAGCRSATKPIGCGRTACVDGEHWGRQALMDALAGTHPDLPSHAQVRAAHMVTVPQYMQTFEEATKRVAVHAPNGTVLVLPATVLAQDAAQLLGVGPITVRPTADAAATRTQAGGGWAVTVTYVQVGGAQQEHYNAAVQLWVVDQSLDAVLTSQRTVNTQGGGQWQVHFRMVASPTFRCFHIVPLLGPDRQRGLMWALPDDSVADVMNRVAALVGRVLPAVEMASITITRAADGGGGAIREGYWTLRRGAGGGVMVDYGDWDRTSDGTRQFTHASIMPDQPGEGLRPGVAIDTSTQMWNRLVSVSATEVRWLDSDQLDEADVWRHELLLPHVQPQQRREADVRADQGPAPPGARFPPPPPPGGCSPPGPSQQETPAQARTPPSPVRQQRPAGGEAAQHGAGGTGGLSRKRGPEHMGSAVGADGQRKPQEGHFRAREQRDAEGLAAASKLARDGAARARKAERKTCTAPSQAAQEASAGPATDEVPQEDWQFLTPCVGTPGAAEHLPLLQGFLVGSAAGAGDPQPAADQPDPPPAGLAWIGGLWPTVHATITATLHRWPHHMGGVDAAMADQISRLNGFGSTDALRDHALASQDDLLGAATFLVAEASLRMGTGVASLTDTKKEKAFKKKQRRELRAVLALLWQVKLLLLYEQCLWTDIQGNLDNMEDCVREQVGQPAPLALGAGSGEEELGPEAVLLQLAGGPALQPGQQTAAHWQGQGRPQQQDGALGDDSDSDKEDAQLTLDTDAAVAHWTRSAATGIWTAHNWDMAKAPLGTVIDLSKGTKVNSPTALVKAPTGKWYWLPLDEVCQEALAQFVETRPDEAWHCIGDMSEALGVHNRDPKTTTGMRKRWHNSAVKEDHSPGPEGEVGGCVAQARQLENGRTEVRVHWDSQLEPGDWIPEDDAPVDFVCTFRERQGVGDGAREPPVVPPAAPPVVSGAAPTAAGDAPSGVASQVTLAATPREEEQEHEANERADIARQAAADMRAMVQAMDKDAEALETHLEMAMAEAVAREDRAEAATSAEAKARRERIAAKQREEAQFWEEEAALQMRLQALKQRRDEAEASLAQFGTPADGDAVLGGPTPKAGTLPEQGDGVVDQLRQDVAQMKQMQKEMRDWMAATRTAGVTPLQDNAVQQRLLEVQARRVEQQAAAAAVRARTNLRAGLREDGTLHDDATWINETHTALGAAPAAPNVWTGYTHAETEVRYFLNKLAPKGGKVVDDMEFAHRPPLIALAQMLGIDPKGRCKRQPNFAVDIRMFHPASQVVPQGPFHTTEMAALKKEEESHLVAAGGLVVNLGASAGSKRVLPTLTTPRDITKWEDFVLAMHFMAHWAGRLVDDQARTFGEARVLGAKQFLEDMVTKYTHLWQGTAMFRGDMALFLQFHAAVMDRFMASRSMEFDLDSPEAGRLLQYYKDLAERKAHETLEARHAQLLKQVSSRPPLAPGGGGQGGARPTGAGTPGAGNPGPATAGAPGGGFNPPAPAGQPGAGSPPGVPTISKAIKKYKGLKEPVSGLTYCIRALYGTCTNQFDAATNSCQFKGTNGPIYLSHNCVRCDQCHPLAGDGTCPNPLR